MDNENIVLLTTQNYSIIKENGIMNFVGKWVELENTVLNEIA